MYFRTWNINENLSLKKKKSFPNLKQLSDPRDAFRSINMHICYVNKKFDIGYKKKKPMSSNRLELSHGKSSGGLAFTQSWLTLDKKLRLELYPIPVLYHTKRSRADPLVFDTIPVSTSKCL